MLTAHDYKDGVESRIEVLVEELNELGSGDFVPSERFGFVERRRRARQLKKIPEAGWTLLCAVIRSGQASKEDMHQLRAIAGALEIPRPDRHFLNNERDAHFGAANIIEVAAKFFTGLADFLEQGYGGGALKTRDFNWVKNPKLRTIVDRDYKELMLKVFPSGAWKMTVVAAGSILEAVLYDLLTRTAKQISEAQNEPIAPKKQDPAGAKGVKVPRDIKKNTGEDRWDLVDLLPWHDSCSLMYG